MEKLTKRGDLDANVRAMRRIMAVPEHTPPPDDHVNLLEKHRIGLGANAGKHPKYRTALQLQEAIDGYFADIDAENAKRKAENDEVNTARKALELAPVKLERAHPTMSGLARAVGFSSRAYLMTYMERGEEFAEVLMLAQTHIEDYKNQMLLNAEKSAHGIIFDLKNAHGWTDKKETTTKVEAGNTLADLLLALQGNVLRPVLEVDHDPEYLEATDAEYEEVPVPEPAEKTLMERVPPELKDLI